MRILGYEYEVRAVDSDATEGMGRIKVVAQQIQVRDELNYHLELNLEHRVIMALEVGPYQVLTENGVSLAPLLVQRA